MTDPVSELLMFCATQLGIPPVTAALAIPLLILSCSRIARIIPDNATGPLKWIRLACKIIGLYVKDNTGVPAIVDTDGVAVRRTPLEQTPEPVEFAPDALPTPNLFTGVKLNDEG